MDEDRNFLKSLMEYLEDDSEESKASAILTAGH
jgi:hypothetical protein